MNYFLHAHRRSGVRNIVGVKNIEYTVKILCEKNIKNYHPLKLRVRADWRIIVLLIKKNYL